MLLFSQLIVEFTYWPTDG